VRPIPPTADLIVVRNALGGEGNRNAMPKRSELAGFIDPYRFTTLSTRTSL
jgi:hypothetical protein